MANKGVLSKNYYIDSVVVTDFGTNIYNMMAEADQAMAEASEIIADIASLTERVPSHIRCNELLEACASAQAEIKSVDFLSYGQKVDQGLQNLLDHNQYITEHFIKNMEAHTEKMRGLGEEFRRLSELITYSGQSMPLKGIAFSAVSKTEVENTDGTEENLSGQGKEEEIEESLTEMDRLISNGQNILLRCLEGENGMDSDEIEWICTYIRLCQPVRLINLYMVNRYSSANTNLVYDAIMEYYNSRPDTPLYKTTENRISEISDFKPNFDDEIQSFLDAFEQNKKVYEKISERTGVPIEVIAIIHYRENTSDYLDGTFNIDIRNGDDLPANTTGNESEAGDEIPHIQFINQAEIVFNDAYFKYFLDLYSLYPETDDVIGMLCYMEVYNGLGYYNHGDVSPYIYSGTPLYESGKCPEDGVYDPNLKDQQIGALCLIYALRGELNYE